MKKDHTGQEFGAFRELFQFTEENYREKWYEFFALNKQRERSVEVLIGKFQIIKSSLPVCGRYIYDNR